MYYGDSYADKATMRLEGKIKRIYAEAYSDIEKKLNNFTRKSALKEEYYKSKVQSGEMTQQELDQWKQGQVFIGKRWKDLRQNISEEMYHTRVSATDMINGERKAVFQNNVNYTQYTIDKDFRFGISFDLYDTATVTRLIKDDPDLVPDIKYPDPNIDYAWSKKQIASAITQGVLQGESIPQLAKRIGQKLSSSNEKSMVRCARTAMTGAQNSGRIEAMHNAQDMGIKVQKLWISTLDNRTRDSHQHLDGQVQDVDKPFNSILGEIMYPGDPNASPANVWQCRCTLGWEYPEYQNEYDQRRARNEAVENELIDNMTYDEWKQWVADGKPEIKRELEKKPEAEKSFYNSEHYTRDKYDDEYDKQFKQYDALREDMRKNKERLSKEKQAVDEEYDRLKKELNNLPWHNSELYDELMARKVEIEKQLKSLGLRRKELYKELRSVENDIYKLRDELDKNYGIEQTACSLEGKVKWIAPQLSSNGFDINKTIEQLGGGDLTEGSCATLVLCYAGRKAGYDILDFRDGKSREVVSGAINDIISTVRNDGVNVHKITEDTFVNAGKKALQKMEEGKEYILSVAQHASIVRKVKDDYQYLELQSPNNNGWKSFSERGIGRTFQSRFGARLGKEHIQFDCDAWLVDVDQLSQDERVLKILGYVNTKAEEQKKGAKGSVR